jgi:hypothetical protein
VVSGVPVEITLRIEDILVAYHKLPLIVYKLWLSYRLIKRVITLLVTTSLLFSFLVFLNFEWKFLASYDMFSGLGEPREGLAFT